MEIGGLEPPSLDFQSSAIAFSAIFPKNYHKWIHEGLEPSIGDCKSPVFPVTPMTQISRYGTGKN